jgi:hypothetical protein
MVQKEHQVKEESTPKPKEEVKYKKVFRTKLKL